MRIITERLERTFYCVLKRKMYVLLEIAAMYDSVIVKMHMLYLLRFRT